MAPAVRFRLLDVVWKPAVNWMKVSHDCGTEFWARLDRWSVACPGCGAGCNIDDIRLQLPRS